MNKIQVKLIAMALALTLSVSVVIMSSYAWMVLSGNPAATGIQVVIGGGNTILIAPNIKTDDGYNIPGRFSDKMNFGQQKDYEYLSTVAGLTPVSTVNGIDWYLSGGKADSFLSHANIPKYDSEGKINGESARKIQEGSYIYLDFWVAAPNGDYTLRVSTGTEDSEGGDSGGSFVIDLLEPVSAEKGWVLSEPEGSAAAAIRIGFMANPIMLEKEMEVYAGSIYNDNRFTALRGLYLEPETGSFTIDSQRFVIYEPNGDFHPGKEDLEGTYVQTFPMKYENGNWVEESDIWDSLAVQLKSDWNENGLIEEKFQTVLFGKQELNGKNADEVSAYFYQSLQGQISPYVVNGSFVSKTGDLKNNAADGKVSAEALGAMDKSGAANDVFIIELERNIPQRIRMFIWLEGQDIDCAASADSARFAVNIELAGGTE